MLNKRPDLKSIFKNQINRAVKGMFSGTALPPYDLIILGQVEDKIILACHKDGGNVWAWSGGEYGNRKVCLTYPPLMPKAIGKEPVAVLPKNSSPAAVMGQLKALAAERSWEKNREN